METKTLPIYRTRCVHCKRQWGTHEEHFHFGPSDCEPMAFPPVGYSDLGDHIVPQLFCSNCLAYVLTPQDVRAHFDDLRERKIVSASEIALAIAFLDELEREDSRVPLESRIAKAYR